MATASKTHCPACDGIDEMAGWLNLNGRMLTADDLALALGVTKKTAQNNVYAGNYPLVVKVRDRYVGNTIAAQLYADASNRVDHICGKAN
jgi:hypothetical protein